MVLRDTLRLEDQKALVFSSTGYGILGGFAGWGLMSILSSLIVLLRWCKAKERSFSDKLNIFFFMLMSIVLVSYHSIYSCYCSVIFRHFYHAISSWRSYKCNKCLVWYYYQILPTYSATCGCLASRRRSQLSLMVHLLAYVS